MPSASNLSPASSPGSAALTFPEPIATAVEAEEHTAWITGHALSCDCTPCCLVRTEAAISIMRAAPRKAVQS